MNFRQKLLPQKGEFIHGKGGSCVGTGELNLAKGEDGRFYAVKSPYWWGHLLPIRLANELLYYVLADEYDLPMPTPSILRIDGTSYWGTEFRSQVTPLSSNQKHPPSGEEIAFVRSHFEADGQQLKKFVLSRVLDVALVNSDRTPWAMMRDTQGQRPHYLYFDHDRSLGWHGEPNHVVRTADEVDFDNCFGRGPFIDSLVSLTSVKQHLSALEELEFDIVKLDAAYQLVPSEWLPQDKYEDLRTFTGQWWRVFPTRYASFVKGNRLVQKAR